MNIPYYKYLILINENIITDIDISIKNKKETIYVLNESYYSKIFGFTGERFI